jgi:glycosyltransferase involved in cell wall biosynthesis
VSFAKPKAVAIKILQVSTIDLTPHCFLRTTFSALRKQGYELALACSLGPHRQSLAPHCDHLFDLPMARQIQPAQDFRSLLALIRLCRSYRPTLIHSYTSKAGFLARLAAKLAGVPLIVHTILELPQNSTDNLWKKKFYWALERMAANWSHHLLTISEANRRQILAEAICSDHQLSTIRYGLKLDQYQPSQSRAQVRAQLGIPEKAPVIGMAARLEPVKGHRDLLAAFQIVLSHHPEAHLVLTGKGPLEAELRLHISQLGLDQRIHVLGWVEDLVSVMASWDVFAFSSHYEGLGMVLLEAFALGVPVVSTQVGGTQDIVDHEQNGLFVARKQPEQMAEAILRLLADPTLARRLAEAGKAKVERDFRSQDMDQSVVELYARLLSCRGLLP